MEGNKKLREILDSLLKDYSEYSKERELIFTRMQRSQWRIDELELRKARILDGQMRATYRYINQIAEMLDLLVVNAREKAIDEEETGQTFKYTYYQVVEKNG